jgi:glycosyltransferase involved in cell wall biosynthesis
MVDAQDDKLEQMPKKTNILLFQRLIPHYRVPLFKKLYDELGIVVCHSRARKGASLKGQQELDFPTISLPRIYIGKAPTSMVQCLLPTLFNQKPRVVITEFSLQYLTFWWLLLLRPFFGYKLVVWTHGVKSKELLHPFTTFRSKIQLWVYERAQAVILYSEPNKEILAQHIKRPEKLFVANNTLDTEKLDEICKELANKGKTLVKKQLDFTHPYNLVFIGRLLKRKRLDLLFEAFQSVQHQFDVGLHIIGDGPEEEMVRTITKNHTAIHYHGAIHDLQLSSTYLFAFDLMVMPGYVGLSAVHAMALGCPVLTCKQGEYGPYHGPEAAYIKNQINGLLCDYNSDAIASEITMLLNNPDLLQPMSVSARKTIQEEASLDKFVSGFEQAVNYVGE